MRHQISLQGTLFLKLGFLVLWFGLVSIPTWWVLFQPTTLTYEKWSISITWIVGTMVVIRLWGVLSLKSVSIDYEDWSLYVSNNLTEVAIPLENVIRAYESQKFGDGGNAVIELRAPSAFGQRIVFRPKASIFLVDEQKNNPIIEELQIIAQRNRSQSLPACPNDKS